MDDGTQPMPIPNPQPAPPSPAPAPAPAPPAGAPQEATGDTESDGPVSASDPTGGDRRPSVAAVYAEDDAESCSGAGGGDNYFVPVGDDDGRGTDDDVAMEGDESEDEVDSRMCGPWWRRTVQLDAPDGASAGAGAGGGCARPQAAAVVAGPGHTAESNRLFWEACIAHGY